MAFGLTNVTLGNAVHGANHYYGFICNNLGTIGTDGVSIDLGEADSGGHGGGNQHGCAERTGGVRIRVFGVETAGSLDGTFYVSDLPINCVGDQATMIVPVFDPR